MLTRLFASFGWSRDDAKWLIAQIVTVAGLIAANVINLPYWATYLGIPLTLTEEHWIEVLAVIILWMAGKYDSSGLPSKATVQGTTVSPSTTSKLPPVAGLLLVGALALGAIPFLSACVHTAPTPVANVADIATRIEQSANTILSAARSAAQIAPSPTGKPLLTEAQVDQIAIQVNRLGNEGLVLRKALDDYNAATLGGGSLTSQIAAVNAALADITTAMNIIGTAIPKGTITAIDDAAAAILSLVAQIQGSLKAGVPEVRYVQGY